jgi:hypothetical protein
MTRWLDGFLYAHFGWSLDLPGVVSLGERHSHGHIRRKIAVTDYVCR